MSFELFTLAMYCIRCLAHIGGGGTVAAAERSRVAAARVPAARPLARGCFPGTLATCGFGRGGAVELEAYTRELWAPRNEVQYAAVFPAPLQLYSCMRDCRW